MTEFLFNDLLLNEIQHGFMPRKSCTTNLIKSLDILTDALKNGKIVGVIWSYLKFCTNGKNGSFLQTNIYNLVITCSNWSLELNFK